MFACAVARVHFAPMGEDERAVTALGCALIASILINVAMIFWWCKSPSDDALPEIDELLGATLLNEPEEAVFDRSGADDPKSSVQQTDPDT